jgi:hypothetical protein
MKERRQVKEGFLGIQISSDMDCVCMPFRG